MPNEKARSRRQWQACYIHFWRCVGSLLHRAHLSPCCCALCQCRLVLMLSQVLEPAALGLASLCFVRLLAMPLVLLLMCMLSVTTRAFTSPPHLPSPTQNPTTTLAHKHHIMKTHNLISDAYPLTSPHIYATMVCHRAQEKTNSKATRSSVFAALNIWLLASVEGQQWRPWSVARRVCDPAKAASETIFVTDTLLNMSLSF